MLASHASAPSLTYLAATRLEKLRDEDLSAEVQQKAVACLLDYIGALVSGLSAPWSNALLSYARSLSVENGTSDVISLENPVPAEVAAFANASIAHSMIRDDMHLSAGGHIGVMVVPAALALAQRDGWSGDTLLKAIVAGYDMAVSLGSALRSASTSNDHFRPSGLIGAFGSAAAGAVAQRAMTTAEVASALGLAANTAAGLNEWAWAGGLEMNVQMGTASRNGIISLDLARHGFKCSETVLEGKNGFFTAYGSGLDGADNFRSWMTTSRQGAGIMDARFKPLAGCNFIQTPVSVALRLREKVVHDLENIVQIIITTTSAARAYPGCDSQGPFEKVQQTKMSLQYGVSAALRCDSIEERMYHHFNDQMLQHLIDKCVLKSDQDFDEQLTQGKQPCRIEITLDCGTRYKDYLPDVPWLDADTVEQRTRKELATMLDVGSADAIVLACKNLPAADRCTELFGLLHKG